jgi:hypothetical protein
MAITVSGPIIIFDDTSVAQASFYDETFGTGVFPEGGTSLTISGGTAFSSATDGKGNVATVVGVKTDASVILTTPQSGSITVNPIVSGVYVFAIGGGGGGGGTSPNSRTAGSSGTPSFFSTVIGNSGAGGSPGGGTGGGTGGTATGGTTNTSGTTGVPTVTAGGAGNGGAAGGFPGGLSGAGGDGADTPFLPDSGGAGGNYGGGGGGSSSPAPGFIFSVDGSGGGGGGRAIHTRLTITGGSPYPYQVGAPGAGGVARDPGGAGGGGCLAFTLFD